MWEGTKLFPAEALGKHDGSLLHRCYEQFSHGRRRSLSGQVWKIAIMVLNCVSRGHRVRWCFPHQPPWHNNLSSGLGRRPGNSVMLPTGGSSVARFRCKPAPEFYSKMSFGRRAALFPPMILFFQTIMPMNRRRARIIRGITSICRDIKPHHPGIISSS